MNSDRSPGLRHTARHFREKSERSLPPQRKDFVLRMAGRRRTRIVGRGSSACKRWREGVILLIEV